MYYKEIIQKLGFSHLCSHLSFLLISRKGTKMAEKKESEEVEERTNNFKFCRMICSLLFIFFLIFILIFNFYFLLVTLNAYKGFPWRHREKRMWEERVGSWFLVVVWEANARRKSISEKKEHRCMLVSCESVEIWGHFKVKLVFNKKPISRDRKATQTSISVFGWLGQSKGKSCLPNTKFSLLTWSIGQNWSNKPENGRYTIFQTPALLKCGYYFLEFDLGNLPIWSYVIPTTLLLF